MRAQEKFSIKKLAKTKVPRLPFLKIKDRVLGRDYQLSLVFAPDSLSQKLNRIYRRKNAPTDVLSFPLAKKSGEIFINSKEAARRSNPIGHLFIHALLHLKGYRHGSTMEKQEGKIRRIFGL